ncbi:unnamed protein product, partial [Choristocarpus tenellus]
EFLCTIKFRNQLPDPPLGPHFLNIPMDLDKYVHYSPTTLERNYKWQLHCERDLGVDINLIDTKKYLLPTNPLPLDPSDEALINWKEGKGTHASHEEEDLSTSARRKQVDTSVTWLKKTMYLTNDPFDPVHKFKTERQTQEEQVENLKTEMRQVRSVDRKTLVEESFMHANSGKKLEHATKKGLTAEWVMPVMPDVTLWPNTYTLVTFDKDPTTEEGVKGSL